MWNTMSHGRPWTADDTGQLRRLAARGDDDCAIGRVMGRPRSFIARKRAEHGIERGMSVAMVAAAARINIRRLNRRARA